MASNLEVAGVFELLWFILSIVSLAIFAFLMFGYVLSMAVILLDRQSVPKNPADYDMDYQKVDLTAKDNVELNASKQ